MGRSHGQRGLLSLTFSRKDIIMGKVIAVCISKEKGIQKTPVESIVLKPDWGMERHRFSR